MTRTSRAYALFLLCIAGPLLAAPAAKPKETAKYGVYLRDSRIGSMVSRTFDDVVNNKPATRLEAEMEVKLSALGTEVEQKMAMAHVLNKAGSPLTTDVTMTSLGRVTRINAKYLPDKVLCNVDAGGQKSSKTVPIPKGVTLVGDPQLSAGDKGDELKVGQKATMHFFEPLTMTIQKVSTEVMKAETRTVGGKPVKAFLMKTVNSMSGGSQSWVDEKGHLLEDNNALGLRLVREDLLSEPSTAKYEPPQDFAVATSVRTTVRLAQPKKTTYLKLKISGLPDEDLILSDVRQRAVERQKDGDKVTVVYDIKARELPADALHVAAPGATGAGLGDAPYLGVSDVEIQKQAKALAAGETNRGLIARRVRAWVKGHMQKPNNVGTPRSAGEIMRSRDGVCRDYATLFAAVARAEGVPTRICSGIVYFDGGFFYHAWNECQLTEGEGGWYAFDSTLDEDFVDATHVKFAQGDPSEMFAAVRVVGNIQAEILEYK
jgi:hypothetical protein